MGLANRLAAGVPARNARFEYTVEVLLPDERAALITAALDPSWPDDQLVRVLQDEGIMVGIEAFTAWRAVLRATGTKPDPVPLPPGYEPPLPDIRPVVVP